MTHHDVPVRRHPFAAITLAALCAATPSFGAVTGQWDFNTGSLSATTGQPLLYADGAGGATEAATSFGTTTSFSIPDIGGAPAGVMKYGTNTLPEGFSMPNPAAANGGGSQVNQWTLLMDILFPAESHNRWRAILETDGGLTPDADFFVNPGNGIGIGSYSGTIRSNTWHRLAIVVDTTMDRMRKYIDGVEVGVQSVGGTGALDGRAALAAGGVATLFADDNGETAGGFVNSIQLHDVPLGKGQIAALGGATAAGLPTNLPPVPSFVEKWIPSTGSTPRQGPIGAILDDGDTTIQDSSISLILDGQTVSGTVITRPDGLIRIEKTNAALTLGQHQLVLAYTDSVAGARRLTNEFMAVVFFEDFEGLALSTPVDEVGLPTPEQNLNVWTNRPPAGWSVDNSEFPATIIGPDNPDDNGDGFPDLDGRTEWAGWAFAKKEFWLTADRQRREEFALAEGTLAVADPDEWDDQQHLKSLFNSFLRTPPIPLQGLASNSVFLKFASSWRPESFDDVSPEDSLTGFPGDYSGPEPVATNNQTAIITASFDGGAPVQVFKWDSLAGSPTFHGDTPNEEVVVQISNPAGATNMVLSFEMRLAANDWWWAVDNIAVGSGGTPPLITTQPAGVEVAEGQPASLSVVASGDGVTYQWFRGQGTGRTAVPGATAATFSLATAQIEDAGYYSVEVKNSVGAVNSEAARLTVLPTAAGRVVLLSENFDALPLGPNVDETLAGTEVWTKTAPDGWSIDDTGVPGVGTDEDGVTEWAGWSFARREWWAEAGGNQRRTEFTRGTNAIAIADSDEWDDVAHAAGDMATYLKTEAIVLTGAPTNSVIVKFDSSWRPEPNQKANVTATYDGGAPVEVFRFESDPNSPAYRPDEVNETIAFRLDNPAGATNLVLTFGYFDTRNNWWWAFDNLEVHAGTAGGAQPTLEYGVSGGQLTLSWTGDGFTLEENPALGTGTWTAVAGAGANTATVSTAGGSKFYRLRQ